MAKVENLERAGVILFLSFLSFFATAIGFFQKGMCGNFHCYSIFLVLGIIFLAWGLVETK